MRQTLVASGCGLLGGLVGAGLVAWLGGHEGQGSAAPQSPPAAEVPSPREASGSESELLRRLENIERRLDVLQAHSAALARSAASGAAGAGDSVPGAGDPVFEAAVLDVLERAEDERNVERNERRSERARQQAEYWARELTERLELSPAQAAKLTEIRTQLQTDLRDLGSNADGRFVPRAERRAARAQLRERAEQQLRAVLAPRQLSAYEELDGSFKLARPRDDD